MGPWTHRVPHSFAGRTPFHGVAGWGAFQRRSPTGGAAKGTPLKRRTDGSVPTVPSRTPPVTVTWSAACRGARRTPHTPRPARPTPMPPSFIVPPRLSKSFSYHEPCPYDPPRDRGAAPRLVDAPGSRDSRERAAAGVATGSLRGPAPDRRDDRHRERAGRPDVDGPLPPLLRRLRRGGPRRDHLHVDEAGGPSGRRP